MVSRPDPSPNCELAVVLPVPHSPHTPPSLGRTSFICFGTHVHPSTFPLSPSSSSKMPPFFFSCPSSCARSSEQDKNRQRPDAMAVNHEARALLRDARCAVREDGVGDNASRVSVKCHRSSVKCHRYEWTSENPLPARKARHVRPAAHLNYCASVSVPAGLGTAFDLRIGWHLVQARVK